MKNCPLNGNKKCAGFYCAWWVNGRDGGSCALFVIAEAIARGTDRLM